MLHDDGALARGSERRMPVSQAVHRPGLNLHQGRDSPSKTRKGITFVLVGQTFPFCPFWESAALPGTQFRAFALAVSLSQGRKGLTV